MIVDFNHSDTPDYFECDLCVVGTGAAGLALATSFFNSKHHVVFLEAGEENITDRNQEIYNIEAPYHPFEGAINGRFRVFGGSTTKWGGQSLPFDPIDFEKREWVPNSGWPISFDEVEKYYVQVDNFLQLNSLNYNDSIYNLIKEPSLKESDSLYFRFSKWSPKPNLRETFRAKLKSCYNIHVIQNASLYNIKLNESCSEVAFLEYKNFSNRIGKVKAKKYILACGGIENARLLLASNQQLANGIGNNNDLVGRFLQDHPNAQIGSFHSNANNVQSYFNYFYIGKTRFLPRFIIADKYQRSNGILNDSASLLFITDDNHPFSLAKEVYRKYARGNLSLADLGTALKTIRYVPQLVKTGKKYLIDKKIYTSGARIRLNLMTECTPLWHNRVTLSNRKDALGMPLAVVSWQLDDLVFSTLKSTAALFKSYLDQTGLGTFEVDNWVSSERFDGALGDAKHHIGTTRMGSSKNEGVVDANCKVFDTANLYLAGSSVFPTSSHSNPTSTLIALTFRLAEHIKANLL